MRNFRIISLALIAIVAAIVALGGSSDGSGLRSAALSDYRSNDASADSAPQQQVVNGWVAKDLLTIISTQADDQRPVTLLFLGVLAICIIGITSPQPAPSTRMAMGPGLKGDAVSNGAASVAEELRQIERLRDAGLISVEEFEAKRNALLSEM